MVFDSSLKGSILILSAISKLHLLIFITEAAPEFLFHSCPNTTIYSRNSSYQNNLSSLLSSLSSNVSRDNLFYNATAGNNASDSAYGLFMCRGDIAGNVCNECVITAAREVIKRCPNEKTAYIWYDQCMLRYGNESFFSTMVEVPRVAMLNVNDVAEPARLEEALGDVMDKLATRASSDQSANGGGLKGFATGETNFSSLAQLYNLVQCTPDLSGFDCNQCLRVAIGQFPSCCSGKQGGRVLLPSCNARYEIYPFYDISASAAPSLQPTLQSSPPPSVQGSSKSSEGDGSNSAVLIIAIVVPAVVSIILFAMTFCFLRRRMAKKKYKVTQGMTGDVDENEISVADSLQYDLRTIEAATNKFSADNKIGEGGFGDVFKGTLTNGQEIAVKRLSTSSGQGAQEFKNEVLLVAKLQHRNLVRLLGFCLEGQEKILIYEFVPNKSLDYILFDPKKQQSLDWARRCKIIGGIARGILYLHEDSRLRIIHRDLKASNVLLDSDMNAKISDFGMARIVGVDQSQGSTSRIVGTFGYMSPEYVLHGQFSVKSDVFSFGVLVLEIISGKKNNSFHQSGSSDDLLSHAWKLWRDGAPLDLVDPSLGDSFDRNEVIQCIHIGLLCVQEDLDERPTMASVVLMLSSYSVTLPLPNHPAFFFRSRTMNMPKQPDSDESSSNSKSLPWSVNEVSMSELDPR